MPSHVIKQRVRESFDRAASSYDQAAIVQRTVCQRLLEELDPTSFVAKNKAHVLDAGCGTGYGARLLRERWPNICITGIDFAPSMLKLANSDVESCIAADIEKLPLTTASIDLWWSSLAIQWCHPNAVFAEAARVLKPSGQIAFSTLGSGTFRELDKAFAQIDRHRHTLTFVTPEVLHAALEQAGFRDIRLLRETHTVHYPDLKSLLKSVKAIGAQNVGHGGRNGMLGRHAWKKVEAAYERHRTPAGLPACYDVILGYATK